MALKLWSTNYPAGLDTLTEQPQLVNDVDDTDVSHVHSLRDAIQGLQAEVGSDLLESGSLRRHVSDVTGVTLGVTAFSGGGQANATALINSHTEVTTGAAHGDSVKLPSPTVGDMYTVQNKTGFDVNVFPQTGHEIEDFGVNGAYPLADGSLQMFRAVTATKWVRLNKGRRFRGLDGGANTFQTESGIVVGPFTNVSIASLVPPSGRAFDNTKNEGSRGAFRISVSSTGAWEQLLLRAPSPFPNLAMVVNKLGTANETFYESGEIGIPDDAVLEYSLVSAVTSLSMILEGYWVEG